MKKVLIIDTSILCVWLNIPGMDSCGPDNNKWDRLRVNEKIQEETNEMAIFADRSVIRVIPRRILIVDIGGDVQ